MWFSHVQASFSTCTLSCQLSFGPDAWISSRRSRVGSQWQLLWCCRCVAAVYSQLSPQPRSCLVVVKAASGGWLESGLAGPGEVSGLFWDCTYPRHRGRPVAGVDLKPAFAAPFAVTRPSYFLALLKSGNRQTMSDKAEEKNWLGLTIFVANFKQLFMLYFLLPGLMW